MGNGFTELQEMYETAGWSLRDISDATGLARSTIRKRLLAVGVILRPRGGAKGRRRLTEEELQLTAYLYERMGLTRKEVASALGISESAVRERLQSLGIPRRGPSETNYYRYRVPPKYMP